MAAAAQQRPAIGYGVALAGDRLTVARARRKRGGMEYQVILETDPATADPDPRSEDETRPEVRAMKQEIGSGQALVSLGVPASAGLLRWLQTPFASSRKARRVLPSLLDIQLPFPLEQCAYTVAALRPDEEGKVHALTVAARFTQLEELLETTRAQGLDPALMDHEASALWDLAAAEAGAGPTAVVLLDHARGMVALGTGKQLDSAHSLPGLPKEGSPAAWVDRLHHVLRSRRLDADTPLDWRWAGAAAADEALRSSLETAIREDFGRTRFRVVPSPETAVARALARRVIAGDYESWNLRTGDVEHPILDQRRRRDTRRLGAAILAAGLCLIAVNLAWRAGLGYHDAQLETALRTRAVAMTGLPEDRLRIEPVHVVRTHLASTGPAADPFHDALTPGTSDILYRAMETANRLGLSINRFSASDGTYMISGSGADEAACRRFAAEWPGPESAPEVVPSPGDPNGTTRFTARGTYGSL